LGRALAEANIGLVYGGGRLGLMGQLADSVLAAGGRVTGVIPGFLRAREVAHDGLTAMIEVASMHERKVKMLELAEATITMPGGLGTLDETIEALTWASLGQHHKPVFIVDIAGSARGLLGAIETAIGDGFASSEAHDLFTLVDSVPGLMTALAGHFAGV
jgi:uncharacterized protein (TIGR00730 family)